MESLTQQGHVIRFGVFEADLRAGELRKQGMRVKLQEQPFQVLALLLERPGQVVSRDELRKRLWPDDTFVDFDHSLSTAINKIREALGDSAESPRFIETIPRRGYRFIAVSAPPAPSPVYTPSGIVREVLPNVVTAALESHRAKRRWQIAAVVILALALVVLAAVLIRLRTGG